MRDRLRRRGRRGRRGRESEKTIRIWGFRTSTFITDIRVLVRATAIGRDQGLIEVVDLILHSPLPICEADEEHRDEEDQKQFAHR